MRQFRKLLAGLAGALIVAVAPAFLYAMLAPPSLLRVGTGFSAKLVCSAEFLSGRGPAGALAADVQAPGNPLLRGVTLRNDAAGGLVHTAFLHLIAPANAVFRPGLGCAAVPDGDLARARDQAAPPPPGPSASAALWPAGEGVDLTGHDSLAAILGDAALAGPGMRAIVVVKDGRIVAERYAPGFDARTPQAGWSMTKTVTAALVGTVIEAGKLRLDQDHLLPQWAGDGRARITVAELLSMSSGLKFNEDYGDVSDATRMLYLEPDMAAFAARQPLVAPPGSHFNYSSGTPVILSRIWQNALGDPAAAHAWPRKALFGPLGMGSAVMETDAAGTFVGGSYLYATPRDWARFGLFLLQDGAWDGRQLLPRAYVEMMHSPSAADPAYGKGLVWMDGPADVVHAGDDLKYGLPGDAYWLWGYDGQTVTVIPSARMVVVRMGLTPDRFGYRPQRLVAALLKALGPG